MLADHSLVRAGNAAQLVGIEENALRGLRDLRNDTQCVSVLQVG